MLPVAWLAMPSPMVVWSMSDVMSTKRHISAVVDGVLPSHKVRIDEISKDTGMTMSASSRNEYLHDCWASDSMWLCSFLPSALMICGLMALRMACETNWMELSTCEAMPYAALMMVPKKLFSTMAMPCVRPMMQPVL